MHDRLERAGIKCTCALESKCKTQQPVAAGGLCAKDRFDIDLDRDMVRCPAGHNAPIRPAKATGTGTGTASLFPFCTHCPLRS